MRYWTTSLSALALSAAIAMAGCHKTNRARAQHGIAALSFSECTAELNKILGPALVPASPAENGSAGNAGPDGRDNPRPLLGMQIVLSINGSIMGHEDPDADVDDVCYQQHNAANFKKLLAALSDEKLPPTVDFIIGNSFDPELGAEWVKSGNLLANTTYDNKRAVQLTTTQFLQDIDKDRSALAGCATQEVHPVKYFRYPGLKRKHDRIEQDQIDQYLRREGYTVVPYTIDPQEDRFSDIYCRAAGQADKSCANLAKVEFFSFLLDTTVRARAACRSAAGRDTPQILVLWADQFTCDNLGSIVDWYRRLGATFVGLDAALRDPFYADNPDAEITAASIPNIVRDAQNQRTP